jgi:hypothetical protein
MCIILHVFIYKEVAMFSCNWHCYVFVIEGAITINFIILFRIHCVVETMAYILDLQYMIHHQVKNESERNKKL